AFIGFVFSGIIFYSKNGRDKTMIYLNLLILSISFNNIQSFILAERLFQHKFSLDYIQIPWLFLCAPFFYMFLIHYLDITRDKPKILKVVIPTFILACIVQIIFVTMIVDNDNINQREIIYEKYITTEEVLIVISSLSIFIYSFYILYKKEKLFSKILLFDNLKWLYNFFILSTTCYVLWIIAIIIKVNLGYFDFLSSYYPLRILTTTIIFWLGYQAVIHLQILKDRKEIRQKVSNIKPKKIPIEKKEEEFEQDFSVIDSFIRNGEKFLEPKYTLKSLAKDLKLGSGRISVAINRSINKSFIDYINEMRVNYAKNILVSPDYKKYTITSIGLESGFNSKSTFYTVFKKHTGYTPLAYRKQSVA
ncbi:helix-turn-helix domain-containing protein, partial [Tenacibaculum maritimum]|uniref:helix-turn-helix domain-containing protein n=2 Tax=Tenacibaculum maritimum TaxID=107401 RepID=UPI003875D1AF